MASYTASVEAGNGGTNAVFSNGKSVKTLYLPSVRAQATGDTLELGPQFELDYQWVDWQGQRYIVGDDVLRITRRGLERHTGQNRYGGEFHQFLTAVSLARLGIKSGEVDLTLFAPPGLFNEAKGYIKNGFEKAEVEIILKGDKKPRKWRYSDVRVLPEGLGAAACFTFDEKGNSIVDDALIGDVIALDSGVYTLDALKLLDGNFNPETLEHATWQDAGLNTHVRQPLLRLVHQKGDDFTITTVDDVDQTLRRGLLHDDYSMTIAGQTIDLTTAVEQLAQRYAEWIANNVLDGVYNGLRGIRRVILVGGGAMLIHPYITDWYQEKIIDLEQHPQTAGVHPVDLNAVGGLRLALAAQKGNT